MSKTAYRTWIYGELVTVSMMNQQIRDNGNAIWVGTTAGDMDYYTGATGKARIPIGTAGQVLTVNAGATAPEWGISSGGVVKRQGGSATVWSTPGTTNYTPTISKIQAGVIAVVVPSGILQVTTNVVFPEAFAYAPIVFCHYSGGTGGSYTHPITTYVDNLVNTGMSIVLRTGGETTHTFHIHWMAIGY
jgi:hypothetical protein